MVTVEAPLKTCAVCGLPKPRDAYWADASRRDRLSRACKPCVRARQAASAQRQQAALRALPPEPPPDQDWARAAWLLQVNAELLLDALDDAADAGTPGLLRFVVERLFGVLPDELECDPDPGIDYLRLLARIHTNTLMERFPVLDAAVWGPDPPDAPTGDVLA